MTMHDERDRVSRQGTEAWRRLKREKSWGDWIKVGEALVVGRDFAMNAAGTNRPEGKGYNLAFGEWLAQYKLDDMDKGDRCRLDNLVNVTAWRQTLTLSQRLTLNHPSSVWRKFKKAIEPAADPTAEPKPTLRDSVAMLSEENHVKDNQIAQLCERIVELEQELASMTKQRDDWIKVWKGELDALALQPLAAGALEKIITEKK